MEDRYLYRAKRKNWRELTKEMWWVTGYLVNKKCGKYNTVGFEEFEEMVIVTQFSDGGIDWCYIEKDTICQCTGLKDKSGKLIWENDIANCMDAECCGYIGWNESEAGFYFNALLEDGRFEEEHIYDYQDCMEVIGNMIDNPELLEV